MGLQRSGRNPLQSVSHSGEGWWRSDLSLKMSISVLLPLLSVSTSRQYTSFRNSAWGCWAETANANHSRASWTFIFPGQPKRQSGIFQNACRQNPPSTKITKCPFLIPPSLSHLASLSSWYAQLVTLYFSRKRTEKKRPGRRNSRKWQRIEA